MHEKTKQDNQTLIDFWDKAFAMTDKDLEKARENGPESWKDRAPSAKLFEAARTLGQKKKVLDYGCGSAWAGIIAAKSGCPDVTAADAAPGAVKTAQFYASYYGVEDCVHTVCITPGWLQSIPVSTFGGFICSNVLDVVPPETTEEILCESARIVTQDARIIVGLNYYLSPEAAAKRGLELTDGNRLYLNGVLRLVSYTDEEWTKIFAPWYKVEKLEHFAWAGEEKERRRLFWLKRKENAAEI